MRPSPPRRLLAWSCALLLSLAVVAGTALPASAETAGYAAFTFTGTSRDFSGTMQQRANGFPAAEFTTDSVGPGVGPQSGANTFMSEGTPPFADYGSSRGQAYLNLRPRDQSGPGPSVTTYTFERPTPAAGWTFVLGDVDADRVEITATGVDGQAVAPSALGFQSVFNYCDRTLPTPRSTCTPPNNSGNNLPTWDADAGVLDGDPGSANLDTAGASAWFEPNVALTSLTFTFIRDAGFPVYQTWFASQRFDISGTVTGEEGVSPANRELVLYDPEGNELDRTRTDGQGNYSFPDYATYDGYRVVLVRPTGLASNDPLSRTVDLSQADQDTVNFSLRPIVPTSASGTIRSGGPTGPGVPGVEVTLRDPDGDTVATAVTGPDGSYLFDKIPVGDNYTVSPTAPDGFTIDSPDTLTFSVPADTETPVTLLDFVLIPVPTGTATGTVNDTDGNPVTGVLITVEGPGNTEYLVRTNDEGAWSVDDLPAGVAYTARVTPPEGADVQGDASLDFTIPSGGGTRDDLNFVIELPTPPPTYDLGGRVIDEDGDPVQGVTVVVTPSDGGVPFTDATSGNGRYEVPDLPHSTYQVAPRAPRGFTVEPVSREVDLDGDNGDINFRLVRGPVATPTPTPTSPPTVEPVNDDPDDSSDTSDSDTATRLADTGGPSVLIGVAGAVLVGSGALLLAARRRRSGR